MLNILNAARNSYNYIIVDLPPFGPVVDAKAFEPSVDAFVLVAEWGATPRNLVRTALRTEPRIAAKVLGAVLNAIFEQSLADVQATFAAADRELRAADRLPALLRSGAAIVPRHRNFWTVWYGLRMQRDVMTSLGPSVAEFTAAIVRTLERYLADINWPEAEVEARLLFAQIDGLFQHYVLDPEQFPLTDVIERLIERYSRANRHENRTA